MHRNSGSRSRNSISGNDTLFGGVEVFYQPFVDFFRAVYSYYREVYVAVVKGVVFGFPVFRAVIGIGALELLAEKFGRLGIISAYGVFIIFKAAVVMVAERHHKWDVLRYSYKPAERAVPLNLMLTAVRIVSAGQDKAGVGVLFEHLFDKAVEMRIIRAVKRLALLLIRYAEKFEFSEIFGCGREKEFLASVFAVSTGVEIFRVRLEPRKVCPEHIAYVDIALENIRCRIDAHSFIAAVLAAENIPLLDIRAGSPCDGHGGCGIALDAEHYVIRLFRRASHRFYRLTHFNPSF